MARRNIEGSRIVDSMLGAKLLFDHTYQVLGGTFTMADGMPPVLVLDANGATRIVLLPPERRGLFFIIFNLTAATHALTVKEDSNTTTILSIAATKTGIFFCDGTTWRCMGGA